MINDADQEPLNDIDEYYEEPVLLRPEKEEVTIQEEEQSEPQQYCSYQELRFRNFKLQTDSDGDHFCFLGQHHYIIVDKILCKINEKEIFIIGRYFLNVADFFSKPVKSEEVGVVSCNNHLSEAKWFSITELQTKCYAFPITMDEWAVVQYLH